MFSKLNKNSILHSYWSDCGVTGRSTVDEPADGGALIPERSADGPFSATDLPNWAFFLIGLVVGGIVTVGVIAIIAIGKHRSEVCFFFRKLTIVICMDKLFAHLLFCFQRNANEQSLMEGKVGSAGSSTLIPQIRRRNSFGKL